MRTRESNATYPKTPPKTSGNPNFRGDVTSGSPIGDAQWYYYYSSSTQMYPLRMRTRSHPRLPDSASSGHVPDVTSGEKVLPGGYCATSGCACAYHTSGFWPPVTSLPAAHTHVITSGSTTSQHHLKYNFVTTYKLLESKPYSLKTPLLLFVKCVWFHCGISGQRNITS